MKIDSDGSIFLDSLSKFPLKIFKHKDEIKSIRFMIGEIRTIPNKIGDLHSLESLTIYDNYIKRIPANIGKLKNLYYLFLSTNCITKIPKEIGNLSNLTSLNLCYNYITFIPPEIGQLTNLKTLYLSSNSLTSIPIELFNCTQLSTLSFSNNQITEIPNEIGQLTRLRELVVCNNNLVTLPPEIGNIYTINYFSFSGNPLEYIPPQILRLENRLKNGQNIYNDRQSVHNTTIQQSFRKSVTKLTKIKPALNLEQTINEILSSELDESTKKSLVEYSSMNDIHGDLNLSFGELLVSVWDVIRINENKNDLLSILNNEMSDSLCVCFTGRMTRLLNTLNGYHPDVVIEISEREQLSNLVILTKQLIFPYDINLHRDLFVKEAKERNYSSEIIQEWINYFE